MDESLSGMMDGLHFGSLEDLVKNETWATVNKAHPDLTLVQLHPLHKGQVSILANILIDLSRSNWTRTQIKEWLVERSL